MEKEDTISVQWAQEDVETSYNLLNNNKPEGNRQFGRRSLRREDNIKMDLQEVRRGTMDWIDLARDRDKWRTVVKAVMNLHNHHHHRVLLLLVEHRASMKSFQDLRSPAIPVASFHGFHVFLISSSFVLRDVLFGLPLLLYP
jgi:hypothetical protein